MRLLIDGNAYLNPALLRGVDHDAGRVVDFEGKSVQVNGAQYGIDGFWGKVSKDLEHFSLAPRDCVLVWDGVGSKALRRTFLPTYKEGRDKCPEVSEQLNIARDYVTQMAYHLGVHVVSQAGYEADDVLGYLCQHLRTQRNVVCTVDGDLNVLVDDNTDVWRLGELNVNPYGPFPHKYITLYKSLVGDTSDKIPGAKGFGDAAWVELIRNVGFEGLDELVNLITSDKIDDLRDMIECNPGVKLKTILDAKLMVATSWRCAVLHTDKINTMRKPVVVVPGMVGQWDGVPESLRAHDLKKFYGTKTLVSAANFDRAYAQFAARVGESPFVALDIETSASEASAEWSARLESLTENKRRRLDVLGHELTGMSLTFGANTQHTIYMPVDHKDSDNVAVDQCRAMCELIPQALHTVIQNRQFELSVLYRTWGDKWLDNGWHGMVPNAIDTKVGGAYVDENLPKGLKDRSQHHLGYSQQTYEQTTTLRVAKGSRPGGTLKAEGGVDPDGVIWETRQYAMNELTALEVFDYGCDDTICTAALHTHYLLIMEMEATLQSFLEVEQLPEYLTSLAYVQGFPISLAKLREMEDKDTARYDAAWETLRTYLLGHGWEGTVCPVYTEMTPANVKEAVALLLESDEVEVEFKTAKRKLNAVASDIRAHFPDEDGGLVAALVEQNKVGELNALVRANFTGEPKIKFNSPKQMQHLFYTVIGITPRIFNKLTDKQSMDPAFVGAFKKMRQAKAGKVVEYTPEEYKALIAKSSTDDTAVDWALAKDPVTDEQRRVLEAYKAVRTVMTRRSLFYKPYKALGHWRDGRLHPSLNQSEAVTLRYSASDPNVQQLPKLDEGGEFREVVEPHAVDCVVVSLDFSGQELRDMAEWSGDENLKACYVGENLKDAHSLTAVAAAPHIWKESITYDAFLDQLKSPDKALAMKAKLLRLDGKTTNFATQYDAMAPKIAESLLVDEETAQAFIDAKAAAFPKIDPWKASVREQLRSDGYVTNRDGARRHLRAQLMSDNKWEASKADRQGPNFKIQSSGAGQTKRAMASMWRRDLFTSKYRSRFYAPIHDEVVFSVHKDDALGCIREVHECMVQPYGGKKIPILSSISLGRNFGQQIECGDFFDADKISSTLKELFPLQ